MSKNSRIDFGFDLPEHQQFQFEWLRKKLFQAQKSNQLQFGTMGETASWGYIESLV